MGSLEAELFGDFDSADEGAAAAKGSGGKGPELPTEEDLAEELFGEGEAKAAKRRPEADKGGRRVKRRKDVAKFYELEAEEAGASEDEEEDGNLDDLIDDSGADLGPRGRSGLRAQLQRQDRELEELQRDMADRKKEGDTGAAKVFGSSFLDRMEEKYKTMEEEDEVVGEGAPAPASPALSFSKKKDTNAYVVPDPKDPKLWVVRTFGPEKALCISLMRKSADFFAQGKPVPIFSVFYSEHLRGYFYVEAFRESDVRDFCRGITGISMWDIKIVPTTQMPQVFNASALDADKRILLKTGDWVRLKRGVYQGDLAQIEEVKDDAYVLKVKPRLRFSLEKVKTDRADKAHAKRPAPRWFNRADVEAGGLMVNTERRFTAKGYVTFFIVDGESYRDGFLFKSFRPHWFDTGDRARPLEHELQDWRFAPPVSENTRPDAETARADDSKLMPPPANVPKKLVPQRSPLTEGDVVIVHSGDLKNLRGVVTKAIFGSPTALVKPLDVQGLEGELNISVSLLSKYFQVGDYVKAVAGEHEGDTGHVVKVLLDEKGGWGYNAIAVVLASSISVEFRVRVDHLRLTVQKPEPKDAEGEFAVGSLVRMEGRQNARGLITRLEAGNRAIVLCTDGSKHDVAVGELEPVALTDQRIYERTVWTLDRKGKKIQPRTIVKCPPSLARTAPVKAEVLYIHNEFCFLKATEGLTGERGYLVCPGNRCEYVFSLQDERSEVAQNVKKDEAGKESYGVVMASQTAWVQPAYKKMMGVVDDERGKGLQLEGTAVRITGGGYKGLRAEVRKHLGDKVSLSLLAKPKLVTVKISDVAPDDFERPRAERFPSSDAAPMTPTAAPMTPFTPASPSPDDDISRDPLAIEGDKASADSPAVGQPAAAPAPVSHSDTDEVASSRGPKRRKARLPSAEGESGELSGSRQVSQSPSALFGQPERPRSDAGSNQGRMPWLMTGVGVNYAREGKACIGWIVKVYADMAHVVSCLAEVGDDSGMHAVKGSVTSPVQCNKRNEAVVVFAGPRRGSKGKVVGLEKDSVYIRLEHTDRGKHTLLFASAAGSDLVRVPRKDVASFSPDWAKAAEDRLKQPPALADGTAAADGERPWWEVDSPAGSVFGGASGTAAAATPRSPMSPDGPEVSVSGTAPVLTPQSPVLSPACESTPAAADAETQQAAAEPQAATAEAAEATAEPLAVTAAAAEAVDATGAADAADAAEAEATKETPTAAAEAATGLPSPASPSSPPDDPETAPAPVDAPPLAAPKEGHQPTDEAAEPEGA